MVNVGQVLRQASSAREPREEPGWNIRAGLLEEVTAELSIGEKLGEPRQREEEAHSS